MHKDQQKASCDKHTKGLIAAGEFMMQCRAEKDYKSSDAMREFLSSKGYSTSFDSEGLCWIRRTR